MTCFYRFLELDRSRRLQLEALQARSQEELKEEILLMDLLRDMLPTLPEQMRLRDEIIRMFVPDELYRQTMQEMLIEAGIAVPNPEPAPDPAASASKKSKKRTLSTDGAEASAPKKKKSRKPTPAAAEESTEAPLLPPSSSAISSPKLKSPPAPAVPLVPAPPKAILRSNTMKPLSKPALTRHVDRIIAEFGLRTPPP